MWSPYTNLLTQVASIAATTWRSCNISKARLFCNTQAMDDYQLDSLWMTINWYQLDIHTWLFCFPPEKLTHIPPENWCPRFISCLKCSLFMGLSLTFCLGAWMIMILNLALPPKENCQKNNQNSPPLIVYGFWGSAYLPKQSRENSFHTWTKISTSLRCASSKPWGIARICSLLLSDFRYPKAASFQAPARMRTHFWLIVLPCEQLHFSPKIYHGNPKKIGGFVDDSPFSKGHPWFQFQPFVFGRPGLCM